LREYDSERSVPIREICNWRPETHVFFNVWKISGGIPPGKSTVL
jgi:hypothetical protein